MLFSGHECTVHGERTNKKRNPGFYREYAVWKDGCSLCKGYSGLRVAGATRLTRDLHREEPYSELLCEESGELLDADHISEEKMALGISEAVYENAICISPLKGNTGAEIVREVQKQMTGFQTTGDCSVDLGKTSQRIKMTKRLPGAGGTPQKGRPAGKRKNFRTD